MSELRIHCGTAQSCSHVIENEVPPDPSADGWDLTWSDDVSQMISCGPPSYVYDEIGASDPPLTAASALVKLIVPKSASCASVHRKLQISGDSAIHSAEDRARPEPDFTMEKLHLSLLLIASVKLVPDTLTEAERVSKGLTGYFEGGRQSQTRNLVFSCNLMAISCQL